MNITAVVEQAEDGSWTACAHIGDELIIGDGNSQDEAVTSLGNGVKTWVEYRKEKGESLPQIVTVEVAT